VRSGAHPMTPRAFRLALYFWLAIGGAVLVLWLVL
jgi:hypothetical protein